MSTGGSFLGSRRFFGGDQALPFARSSGPTQDFPLSVRTQDRRSFSQRRNPIPPSSSASMNASRNGFSSFWVRQSKRSSICFQGRGTAKNASSSLSKRRTSTSLVGSLFRLLRRLPERLRSRPRTVLEEGVGPPGAD